MNTIKHVVEGWARHGLPQEQELLSSSCVPLKNGSIITDFACVSCGPFITTMNNHRRRQCCAFLYYYFSATANKAMCDESSAYYWLKLAIFVKDKNNLSILITRRKLTKAGSIYRFSLRASFETSIVIIYFHLELEGMVSHRTVMSLLKVRADFPCVILGPFIISLSSKHQCIFYYLA